jgi:RHS repeat-associated protein
MLNVHAADLWQMQSRLNASPSQTNSISPDVYEGATMYLAGLSYYKKVGDFTQINQHLQKFTLLSSFAVGLSKIIPARDSFGSLTNGTDPVLPCVDMFFYGAMLAGNGTLHPDSGQNYTMAGLNYNLMQVTDGSAEEHQVINDFYKQTNAVSTIRLLQLAQNGAGIVPLTIYNYASQGTTNYQGKPLQSWDSGLWQSVVSAFQSAPSYGFVTGYITPGPMTNAAYKGMGVLLLEPNICLALISPGSINGGFAGQALPTSSVSAANSDNISLKDNFDNYQITFSQPANNTTLTPDSASSFNATTVAAQESSGNTVNTPFILTSVNSDSQQFALPGGTGNSAVSQNLLNVWQQGNTGTPNDRSQLETTVSDPVNNITGEFYDDETDLALPGPIPLSLRRNYSSQNLADNQFGYGWKLSVIPYLCFSKNSTNIYAADMDGSVLAYVRQPLPAYVSAVGVNNHGSGYHAGDILTVAGGTGTAAQIHVDSVLAGFITGCSLLSGGNYTALPASPNSATGGSGSGATFNLTLSGLTWMPTLAANPQLNNNTVAGVGGLANRLRDYIVRSVNSSVTNYTLYGADGSIRLFQFMNFNSGVITNARPYLVQWTDNRGNFYTFSYDTNSADANFGQMQRIQCSNGNFLGFDYNTYGHIIDAYSGDGRWMNYDYDDFGDLVTVTLPDETTRSYQYQHSTQSVTNGGVVTKLPYSTHLLVEKDQPDGRALINTFDSQRRVTNQLSTAGTDLNPIRTATFTYANNFILTNSYTNAISGYTLIVDGNGNTNRYDYTNNLITKITDPLNQTVQQTWYADNATAPGYPRSVASRTDKRGLVTQYQYDSNGNVTNAIVTGDLTGDGITSQTATNTAIYNANNLPVQKTDAAGNSMVIVYDPVFSFLPQQIIRFTGATPVATNYTLYGNATNVVVNGNVTQTNLAFGLPVRQISAFGSPDAATNDSVFDGHGFLTQSVRYTGTGDPNITNAFFYNERGQMVNQIDALGAVKFFDYDALNRPTAQESFDENGNALSWSFNYYNDNGELSWTDGPRYNPEDYVFFDYDGAGRRSTEIHWRSEAKADGTGVEAPAGYNLYAQSFFQYDPLGNLTLAVDPRGAMTTNTWDALCRLTQKKHLDVDGVTVLSAESFGYEPGGEIQSYTNALGGVTTTLYTATGKPEYRATPEGATNGWRYYLDGRVKREIQGNGAYWQTTYDDANRITTRIFYSAAGSPLATNSTQLDRRGNVVRKVDAGNNVFTTTFDDLDRAKVTAGPAIVTVASYQDISFNIFYTTNVLQQVSTNFYDLAGRAVTNANALGEKSVTRLDALGRTTAGLVYSASGTLAREKYFAYSADHNRVTVTDGSGANAIVSTTCTDNDNHTVLSLSYPSSSTTEFVLNQYDLAGNLVTAQHDSSSGGTVTTWTTTSQVFDGLNRPIGKFDRDGALTTYAYNPLGDVTNRTMPGNLQWQATYNNAGQMSQEKNVGGGSAARTITYNYFSSGSPFAGLLQSKTDGRGVVCTYSYDDWLRPANAAYAGSLPEQNLTTAWQYEPRGFVTNITETFASTNTGPATSVTRSFDPYGQLSGESVNGSVFGYGSSQSWDAAGRRTILNIGSGSYGFNWRADGNLVSANDPTGSGNYTFDTAGLLTSRIVGTRVTSITSRDGEGRPLSIATTVNTLAQLTESLTWSGDGLLATHTLNRSDFTDSRSYAYAPMSRRLTQEQLNLNGSTAWTNNFAYDSGTAAGPGVLTSVAATPSSQGWQGIPDAFSRIGTETNNIISYAAYGHVNGQSTLSAWLDGQPVSVTGIGTNAMQWRAAMELSAGTHQLKLAALHPSGQFTALATNTFTNNIAYQTTGDTFDNAGNITQRVWLNANGTTNKIQTLSWDARGRLHQVTERDAAQNGQNFTVVFDALGRRLQTTQIIVSNGVAMASLPVVVNHYFDPLHEFLELGVNERGGSTAWKLIGPDMNGQYGGQNGTGGFDGFSPYLNLFYPTIADFNGNILGVVTNGVVSWNGSRVAAYGAVPGYRPAVLGSSATLDYKYAYRNRATESIGLVWLGANWYDPVSGHFLSPDPMGHDANTSLYDFCQGNPVGYHWDADGRCVEGGASAVVGLITGTANLLNNAAGTAAYAVASPFAPDWAYQNLGGYAQNFANTVTGTAQFGYDVAATATYGAISPFAPDVAYNNYGGNVQQFMGQTPALYGGNDQSTAYQIGYGTVTAATMFMGGGEGEAGNLGKVGNVVDTAPETTTLYRAVMDPELNSINNSGQFSTLPGSSTPVPGVQGKWFYQNLEDAQNWAGQAAARDGGPLTIVQTTVPKGVAPAYSQPWVDSIQNPAMFYDIGNLNAPIKVVSPPIN